MDRLNVGAGLFVLLALGAVSTHAAAASEPSWEPIASCDSIANVAIAADQIGLPTSGGKIVSAKTMPGSGPNAAPADFIPSYCQVDGYIAPVDPKAPNIEFQVNIPSAWTGKAYQVGGNGQDGFIPLMVQLPRDFGGSPVGATLPPHMPSPIARGYATYGGDSGHQGNFPPGPGRGNMRPPEGQTPPEPVWVKNEEAYANEGYAQIKKTHDAAMWVFRKLYGRKSKITYFGGESNGGRAALQAATLYPDDYDGVLASVPLTYFAGLVAARPLRQIEIAQPGAWISPAKRKLIAKETQRLCDGLDGLKDGVILNYKACDALVRPSKTNAPFRNLRCPDGKDDGDECLSDAQLKTLDMLHSPVELGVPLLNGETFAFAFPAGAEDRGGWAEMPDQDPAGKPAPAIANYHLSLRYAHTPTHGDLYSHTPQEAADIIKDLSAHVDISEDLSKFFARNGKLILYSNGNDYLSNVTGQYYYYEQVQKRLGKAAVKRHFRFYVSPFGPHGGPSTAYGSNTPLPHYTDLMGTLERWVEKGVAPPNALVQTLEDKTPPYTVIRSRIICQYPMHPQYKGSGSADLSTSYVCAG